MEEQAKILDFNKEKLVVDLEDKPGKFQKLLVKEGVYTGVVRGVECISMPDYNDPKKFVAFIVVSLDLDVGGVVTPFSYFVSANVYKARGPEKTNSKLYDLLVLAQVSPVKDGGEGYSVAEFSKVLAGVLVGRRLSVLVETTKKAKVPYSKIRKVFEVL